MTLVRVPPAGATQADELLPERSLSGHVSHAGLLDDLEYGNCLGSKLHLAVAAVLWVHTIEDVTTGLCDFRYGR